MFKQRFLVQKQSVLSFGPVGLSSQPKDRTQIRFCLPLWGPEDLSQRQWLHSVGKPTAWCMERMWLQMDAFKLWFYHLSPRQMFSPAVAEKSPWLAK